ncbi:TerC family protein [Novosphingobium sp. BL-52-GroH]|uniref:TerC family protein n=1 Tax=Novosphingobium sp. BL-52-GroH TaxID=3349877 RepID=UPI0038505B19
MDIVSILAAAAPGIQGPGEIWNHIVTDFSNIGTPAAMSAFLQVLMIDVVLAGDNAIVVGALAAGLPADQRKKVIAIGVIAALVLRIGFALVVTWLLGIVGLVFAGGLLLLWVAWKMYRELHHSPADGQSPGSPEIEGDETSGLKSSKSFASAAISVAVADVSMSIDNVLGVAGAAREHPGILIVGLIVAVAMMGLAANFIARYIERFKWIGWIGLLVIVYVAGKMIYEGWVDPQLGIASLF